MKSIRKSEARGKVVWGGLTSHHSFSFGDYYDPNFMGYRALRVINDDTLQGGMGFPPHPHRDMEIVSYVVDGALEHKDSMGNASVIRPGEVQRMTAGTGVTHSEFNPSKTEGARLLQIWIVPERRGIEPGYEQKSVSLSDAGLIQIAGKSPSSKTAVHINQDAGIFAAKLTDSAAVTLPLQKDRFGWVQVIDGDLEVDGTKLGAGDGLALSELENPKASAQGSAHFLFFDLA